MRHILFVVLLLGGVQVSSGRSFNDKIMNRPYADLRPWHLGFSVGAFSQTLNFTHSGHVTESGEAWVVEQPEYAPGFCVNGLFDWRLSTYFSLRFTPGMYFGNRDVHFLETTSGAKKRQNIKSAFVVTPIDIKISGMRYRNSRPYALAGVMPAFDVSKKRNDLLNLKSSDLYLTVGFGCDFYLPYFKLIPEIKFSFGLMDVLKHDRPDLADDIDNIKFTKSLTKATSKMIILTFYFE